MSSLSDRQFGPGSLANVAEHFAKPPLSGQERGFYRKDYADTPGQRHSFYEYKIPDERHSSHSVHLQGIVHHRAPLASYSYEDDPHEAPEVAAHRHRSHTWLTPAERDRLAGKAQGTPKLFGTHYTPAKSEVHSLFGTREGRAHVGTMLGIAQRQTALETGRSLTPPEDLSLRSSKVVQNLKGRGAVGTDAPEQVTNDYTFFEEPSWAFTAAEHRLPEGEVAKGRSTMRQVLRQGRGPKGPTHVQGSLL